MDQHIPTLMEIMGMSEPESVYQLGESLIMARNKQTPAALKTQDPEKIKRVQTELERLAELFRDVDENKRDFVQRHIEQLAWYNVSIIDLQAKVDQWGTLIEYNNGGNQTGVKPNPDLKTLMDIQKITNTIMRTLIPLVPNKDAGKLADCFDVDDHTTDTDE